MTTCFLDKVRKAKAELAARSVDHPWKLRLQRVQGKDYDGVARVSTQTLLDTFLKFRRTGGRPELTGFLRD
jgi:hypothetical protein